MFKETVLTCCACLVFILTATAQSIAEYRYWWNDDLSTLNTVAVSATSTLNLEIQIPTADLGWGHHNFSIQVKDENGDWSVPYTETFYQNGGLVAYEYWFDDEIESAVSQSIPQTSTMDIEATFDVSSLSPGVHKISIRSVTNNGETSIPYTGIFKKGGGDITSWEYWFDDNVNTSVQEDTSPPENLLNLSDALNTSGLGEGSHTVTWRAADTHSNWSVPVTYAFDLILHIKEIPGLESVLIFPSPARNRLNVKVGMNKELSLNVEILNQAGQVLMVNTEALTSTRTLSMDVSSLVSGTYFVRLSNSHGSSSHKFVKL